MYVGKRGNVYNKRKIKIIWFQCSVNNVYPIPVIIKGECKTVEWEYRL